MVPPIMNAEKPSLAIALKTLWGEAEMPFGDACAEPFRHPGFEEITRRLQQLCDIGASGVLHGPNGIDKSYLCGCFTDKLPEKRYKILSLAHSSLTGSDLIRALCRQLGVNPRCAVATTWPISTRLLASWAAAGRCWCSRKPRTSPPVHWKKCVC